MKLNRLLQLLNHAVITYLLQPCDSLSEIQPFATNRRQIDPMEETFYHRDYERCLVSVHDVFG